VTEGEPYRVELILFLERPDDLIVGMEIVNPAEPLSFAEVLERTIRNPLVGSPRKPTHLRVADPTLAAELRAAIPDLMVEVGPTPELDAVFEHLSDSMTGEESAASYFEDGRVALPDLQRLFAAAARLYPLAPWRFMDDGQLLQLDIPALGIEGACVSIIGALGESIGFLIFPSLLGFDSFRKVADAPLPKRGKLDLGTSILSLNFETTEDLPPSMRREVMSKGLPIADAQAYPRVEHRDRDGVLRPLTAHDIRIATACATALTHFFVQHGDPFSGNQVIRFSESYTDDQQLSVRLSFPHSASPTLRHRRSFAEPVRYTEPKHSRNAPCPCGSGQKYKKCCLAKDEESARGPSSSVPNQHRSALPAGAANAHRIEEPLIPKIFAFAHSRFPDVCVRATADFDDAEASAQLFGPWLFYCIQVEGKSIAEHYLERHSHSLSAQERALLLTQPQAWLSVWEVTDVERGSSVSLKDLLSGEERLVREVKASLIVNKREALLGRVVDFNGESVLAGVHPSTLPPREAAEVVQRTRTKLRRKTAVPLDRLRHESLGRFLIDEWEECVDQLQQRSQIPPELHNTDGDKLLLTRDHFSFDPKHYAQIDRCLRTIPNIDPPDAEGEPYTFLRPGNPIHKDWDTTIVGRAQLASGKLTLETNSIDRADALRKLVEKSCQGLLQHRLREHSDPSGSMLNRETGPTRPTEPPPAEVDALIRQYKANFYARWVDEPIPALGGKTPRQAIRTKAGREHVDVLLKGIEHTESRQAGGPQVDLRSIRAELGLT
jgi:hypothetical protein